MTAPFHLSIGDSDLSVNPGPWGVTVAINDADHAAYGAVTMTAEDATRVAAALILAAATVASYAETQPAQSEGCSHCAMFDRPCDCQQFLAPPAQSVCQCGAPVRGDRGEYSNVCERWPPCEPQPAQSEEPADRQADYRAWLESRGPYPAR